MEAIINLLMIVNLCMGINPEYSKKICVEYMVECTMSRKFEFEACADYWED